MKTIEEQLEHYGKCVVCNNYDFLDTKYSSPSIEKFCGTQCYLTWEYTPHPIFTEKNWWKFGTGILSGRSQCGS